MVLGCIIVYGHPTGAAPGNATRLHRALFGYRDRSKHGRYTYERPGLLTGHAHHVLRAGALLLPLDLQEPVERLVREHGGWSWARRVELTPEETQELYLPAADSAPGAALEPRLRLG